MSLKPNGGNTTSLFPWVPLSSRTFSSLTETTKYPCQVNFLSPAFCVTTPVHPYPLDPDMFASAAWLEGASRGDSFKKLGQTLKMLLARPQTSAWGKTVRPQTSPWFSLQKWDTPPSGTMVRNKNSETAHIDHKWFRLISVRLKRTSCDPLHVLSSF